MFRCTDLCCQFNPSSLGGLPIPPNLPVRPDRHYSFHDDTLPSSEDSRGSALEIIGTVERSEAEEGGSQSHGHSVDSEEGDKKNQRRRADHSEDNSEDYEKENDRSRRIGKEECIEEEKPTSAPEIEATLDVVSYQKHSTHHEDVFKSGDPNQKNGLSPEEQDQDQEQDQEEEQEEATSAGRGSSRRETEVGEGEQSAAKKSASQLEEGEVDREYWCQQLLNQYVEQPTAVDELISRIEDRELGEEILEGFIITLERRGLFRSVFGAQFLRDLAAEKQDVLLRCDSATTKLAQKYLAVHAGPYLPLFFDSFFQKMDSPKALSSSLLVSAKFLFGELLNTLLGETAAQKMVWPVYRLLGIMSTTLSQAWGLPTEQAFGKICCSVYYLRFICPYLASRAFDSALTHNNPEKLVRLRPGYLQAIKMLQCLASDTELSSVAGTADNKEELREKLQQMVEQSRDRFMAHSTRMQPLTADAARGESLSWETLGSQFSPSLVGCLSASAQLCRAALFFKAAMALHPSPLLFPFVSCVRRFDIQLLQLTPLDVSTLDISTALRSKHLPS